MYGGLPTNHRPPQKQRLSSAHPADFRLRLLEAPAYTAEPIKKERIYKQACIRSFFIDSRT